MPAFNPETQEATDFTPTAGSWLVQIAPRITKRDGSIQSGFEAKRTNDGMSEMWKCIAVVVDHTPGAPAGQWVWENLIWDGGHPDLKKRGRGEGRIMALLRALGHPIDEWKRTGKDITPDLIFNRPFVMDLAVEPDDKGRMRLTAAGFMPFHPPSHPTGPREFRSAKSGAKSSGGTSSGSAGTGVEKCFQCSQPASNHPNSACANFISL